jgi:hypothetical protein
MLQTTAPTIWAIQLRPHFTRSTFPLENDDLQIYVNPI